MSTNTLLADSSTIDPGAEGEYRCPYCDQTYSHEWCTRIHITWCDDSTHQTHDGLMPETPVMVHGDGDSRDVTRSPEEIDIDSLEPDDLPDTLSDTQKHIVLVAMNNPYADTYQELTERVEQVFHELDRGAVSYQTVRRTMRDFFEPEEKAETNKGPADGESGTEAMAAGTEPTEEEQALKEYRELTDKQRQVIDARLNQPDASSARLAELADTSRTYPYKVLERHTKLVETLEDIFEGAPEANAAGPDAIAEGDTAENGETQEAIDRPVSAAKGVFTASPEDVEAPSEPAATEGGSEEAEVEPGVSEPAEGSGTVTDTTSSSETESVDSGSQQSPSSGATASLRTDVEQLRSQMAFVRRVAEREGDSNGSRARLALAQEVEAELDAILNDSATETE
jgi:hypothetical protein